MTRIEHIGDATLYLGDCLEIMPTLGKVDAVVTDPPYVGLAGTYKRDYQGGVGKKRTVTQSVGDEWSANLQWIPLAETLARRGMVIFCSFAGISAVQAAIGEMPPIALTTWYKRNSAPTGKNVPYYKTEFAWCFRGDPGIRWDDVETLIDIPNINAGCMATERLVGSDLRALHPTQKPLAVMQKVILSGMNSVLDPFMGSGTTGVACAKLGRKFIGIEIDEGYFDIACKRIEDAYKQPDMFVAPPPKPVQADMLVEDVGI